MGQGRGRFTDANTIAVEGGEDVTFRTAIVATGSFPMRPPIEGLDSPRCVDSTGLLAQQELPKRLVVLGGGIIGCEFASIFARFGSEVTIIEMLPSLIPQEDADAAKELAKQFGKRNIALHLEKQCTKVEDSGSALTVHFGDGETVEADLMLVSVGVRRRSRTSASRSSASSWIGEGHRRRRAPPHHRRPHLRRRRLRRLLAARAHGLPRGRGRGGERDGPRGRRRQPRRPLPDLHRIPRSPASGSPSRRPEQYGDDVEVGMFPWVANARAVMQNETTGWVKSIHESRYGELLGLVMVGPHVTDLIEAGVVAIDAEATVETVADGNGRPPDPLGGDQGSGSGGAGRAIHPPNRSGQPRRPPSGRRPRACRLRRRVRWLLPA